MPLLEHPVPGTFAGHRQTIQLPRESRGEIAHVDHLLDFASAFGADLSDFQSDEHSEVGLVFAQRRAKSPHDVASCRRGQHPPPLKGVASVLDDPFVVVATCRDDAAQDLARRRIDRIEQLAARFTPAPAVDAALLSFDSQSMQHVGKHFGPHFRLLFQSVSAASRISTAMSACSRVITNGGLIRRLLWPQVNNSKPLSKQA